MLYIHDVLNIKNILDMTNLKLGTQKEFINTATMLLIHSVRCTCTLQSPDGSEA